MPIPSDERMKQYVEQVYAEARLMFGADFDVAVFTIAKEPDPQGDADRYVPVVGFATSLPEPELRQVMAGWGMDGGGGTVN